MAGGARGWVAGRAGFWGALATWVWGQAIPVVRVCVTVVDLVQSSFLCTWVSGYCCNLRMRCYIHVVGVLLCLVFGES